MVIGNPNYRFSSRKPQLILYLNPQIYKIFVNTKENYRFKCSEILLILPSIFFVLRLILRYLWQVYTSTYPYAKVVATIATSTPPLIMGIRESCFLL